MNNPDHISRAYKPFFGFKYLNSFMRIQDPGSGMEKFGSGIRDGKKKIRRTQVGARPSILFIYRYSLT
jgi:hypothetical protein